MKSDKFAWEWIRILVETFVTVLLLIVSIAALCASVAAMLVVTEITKEIVFRVGVCFAIGIWGTALSLYALFMKK